MRYYQPTKNNRYRLDSVLFRRMIYLVKDYERMKNLIELQNCDRFSDRHLAGNRIYQECKAIEWALEQIPEEYRKAVLEKVRNDSAYPLHADPSTYSRWKCRFLFYLAKKLMYV